MASQRVSKHMEIFSMNGNSEAIVKTFRQILDIYKQIYMLMETSKELMGARGWKEPTDRRFRAGKVEYYYGVSHEFSQKIVRIPFYIQQPFASDSEPTQIKYITVMIDDEEPSEDFEPVVVGATLKFVDEANKTEWDWGGYWWYHWKWNKAKESNSERHGPWTLENSEVNEIQKQEQDWMSDEVRPNLQSVHTFGIPLVKVTNKETLEEKIIKPLLDVKIPN